MFRQSPSRRVALLRVVVLLVAAGGAAGESGIAVAQSAGKSGGEKTFRLFTIGNSFSGNATRFLPSLAKAGGHALVLRTASVGGAPLSLHWEKVEAHEKDPADPAGLYGSRKSLVEELRAGEWDYVTIQQASIKSHDLDTYRPFARKLHDFIKANAPGAKVLVHQTWAYRVDDKRFAGAPKTGEPATREEMYHMLAKAYRTIASELDVPVVPVGDAFHLADADPVWGYRPDATFDPKAAAPPTLPNQTHSLHVGWTWSVPKDGRPVLKMDGHHASDAGQYLAACVFYEVLFGESVEENSFAPQGMGADYARFLRKTAHKAVAGSADKGPVR